MSTSTITAPSIRLSSVRYGRSRSEYQRPCRSCTSRSLTVIESITSFSSAGMSGTLRLSWMSLSGRPMSVGIRLKSFSARGV
jgi:hypothetical protein